MLGKNCPVGKPECEANCAWLMVGGCAVVVLAKAQAVLAADAADKMVKKEAAPAQTKVSAPKKSPAKPKKAPAAKKGKE